MSEVKWSRRQHEHSGQRVLKYFDKSIPSEQIYSGQIQELNEKKWLTISGADIKIWAGTLGAEKGIVDFNLQVSEKNSSSTGLFKVHVFTLASWNGPIAPIEIWPGLNNSCCRMATSEAEIQGADPGIISELLSAFPNPAENILNLSWSGEEAQFEIIDLMGRRVKQGILQTGNSSFPLESFSDGVYRILVKSHTKFHQIQLSVIK